MISLEELPNTWVQWRSRHAERDQRFDVLDRVVRGDISVFDPDDEELTNASPNLVQVALEDTAEAAALLPTVRVDPFTPGERHTRTADKMEQIGQGYLEASKLDLFIPRTLMDLVGNGMSCWVVEPDFDQKLPLIERKDPRTVYPEPGWRPGDTVNKCIIARELYFTQLPDDWQHKMRSDADDRGLKWDKNMKLTLIEYYDKDCLLIAGIYSSRGTVGGYNISGGSGEVKIPVQFEMFENKHGFCPVVIGQRNTFDGEVRGQFDQILGPYEQHVRLTGMVLDYADQAVYSDVWVKDLIGDMPWGGGGYIELGQNGQIGRVPPAVASLDVQRDLANLIDSIHLGGRWPKSRPGEVDQSIASAKFVEATAGIMNTAIRSYHLIVKYMLEQALRLCFETDKHYFPGSKVAAGTLRNQQYILEYNTSAIDTKHKVRADYGVGLGRDPAQSAVLNIQYSQSGLISEETVQENIDGITDIARERARVDVQQFEKMGMAKLLKGLEEGSIPDEALVEIARARRTGEGLFDLYEKYIVEPKKEAQQGAMDSGLGGPPGVPGPVGPDGLPVALGPDGQPAPPAGGPAGPKPPEAPGPEILSRLGVPAGPGGKIGSQVMGEF